MDGKVCLTDLVEAALRGEYGDMSVKTGVGAPGHVVGPDTRESITVSKQWNQHERAEGSNG